MALVITEAEGSCCFCGRIRLDAVHDLTQVRQAGLVQLLALTPGVTLLADAGYQNLSAPTAGAVLTPRPARRKNQLRVFPAVAPAHEAECGLMRPSGSAWSTASATWRTGGP